MAWNNHQRLLSYFRIFWENIFFLSGTYLESCRWGHMINHYVTRPVTHDVTRPYWFSKAVLWELASFLIQTNSFVPVNVQGCWSRGWKRSICNDWELRQLLNCPDLKKIIIKANYQSKHCTMTEAPQALAFESHENISYQFAYLRSNVHELESHWNRGQFVYKVTTFVQ